MSKSLRFTWMAGWALGALLLGACTMQDQDTDDTNAQAGTEALGRDPTAGELAVSVSASQTTLAASDSVSVDLTLTNIGSHRIRLLSWYTAADGLEDDLFQVTLDGKQVAYTGPHYKRPLPVASDYLTLDPGKSITRTVDLTGFYDLSQTGNYGIRYALELNSQSLKQGETLASNDVGLSIEGRPNTSPDGDVSGGLTSSVSFNRCTTTQQATILDALGAASTMANESVSYLGGNPSGTPRYTTWFGAFSTSGWDKAEADFIAIKDAYDTKPISFDCGCRKKYYAYVYPNQPYNIYLCSVFWNAPLTGTDSKGGTIIHETSHFTVVAGTDDHTYGQTNCKALAISDPAAALDNADSHEYFAENTPHLQ
jgi:peptidyl-Lys metalloendopeptidase